MVQSYRLKVVYFIHHVYYILLICHYILLNIIKNGDNMFKNIKTNLSTLLNSTDPYYMVMNKIIVERTWFG